MSEITNKKNLSSSVSRWTINKDTLPLKLVLFLYYGAMAAILPYLTIHMQVIGITIQETAIIYAVLPFTTFVGPPLMGFLADKLGQYKTVLILCTLANGVFHTSLLAIPAYSEIPIQHSVMFNWDATTNETYFYPNVSQYCENFTTEFSKQLLESSNFETQISACSSWLPNVNESFVKDSCGIRSLDNEFYEFICDPSASSDSVEYSDTQQELMETVDLMMIGKEVRDCKLRSTISGRRFLGEGKSVTCNTNLVLLSGEIITKGNNALTFWLYFLIRVLATLFMSSCFTLLDATMLAVVKMSGSAEYGKERIFAVIGFGAVSPIAGLLVDQVSRHKGYTDYSSAFFVSNILLVFNILTYVFMNLHVEKPEKGFAKNVKNLVQYPEVMVFLFMIFILGSMWGFVESYLFIFLKELNAPNYLLGLTLTVGSLAGIPFSYGSEKILRYFGRVNIIIVAFIAYFVRFFGYSYITNPFWCFPFEAMEAVSYHTMWIAAATYCSELAPKGLLATLMGVMGSLHYSLGKGNGAFIGGYMLGAIGTRLSFRYFGLVSAAFGIVYFILQFFWLEKAVRIRKQNEQTLNSETEASFENVAEKRIEIDSNLNEEKRICTNVSSDVKNDLEDQEASEAMLKNYNSK